MTVSDLLQRLSGLTPVPYQWVATANAINELSALERGWDGDGSEPPTTTAVIAAMRLMTTLKEAGFPAPVRAYPTYSAGVGVEWYFDYTAGHTDYTFVAAEVEADGAVEVFISDGKTQRHDVLEGL